MLYNCHQRFNERHQSQHFFYQLNNKRIHHLGAEIIKFPLTEHC